jgi:hypothetical protein
VQTIEKERNKASGDNGMSSPMIYTNPLYGFVRTLLLFIGGRVQFNQSDVGRTILMGDGKTFEIFRRVMIKRISYHDSKPRGLFIVRFTPTMDVQKNIRLSKIMMLIFMGFKGFRSKFWCVDRETGMCQGIYEWDKLEDAERYSRSIAMRNMTKRSIPGTVSFSVLENSESNRNWQILETEQTLPDSN